MEWPISQFTWCESITLFLLGSCKKEVYPGRAWEPFNSEEELKTKIKAVWKDCTTDLEPFQKVIKQFVPRLRAVEEKQGYCIKIIFGWFDNL